MQLAANCLAETRRMVNIRLWIITVRNRLVRETDPAKRRYLAEMLVALNNRQYGD